MSAGGSRAERRRATGQSAGWRLLLACVLGTGFAGAQAAPVQAAPKQNGKGPAATSGGQIANPDAAVKRSQAESDARTTRQLDEQEARAHPSTAGVLLDRVVAVVNGEVVLESDVEEERRLAPFQPISAPEGAFSRERAVQRLINRKLLLQQSQLQPQQPVTEADIDKEIAELRRDIPACKRYDCATAAGWDKFLAANHVNINELRVHWRERMEALRFIELRFRSGIHIPDEEIKSYYEKTMLPEYARQKVKAPSLEALSVRIQEVLLQQQVSGLLGDWLKSLRAQGTVQVVAEGVNPS